MPAKKLPGVVRCKREEVCHKAATHEVYDRYNRPVGWFCEQHADECVASLDKYEEIIKRAWGR